MTARLLARAALLARLPPWLRRTRGAAIAGAIGDAIDLEIDRTVAGVRLAFPSDDADPDALGYVGRQRRIRRGPGETAIVYAGRLRGWWDAHRRRGGPYALLEQCYAFFRAFLDPIEIDLVAASGLRHRLDDAGAIVRDQITWDADGSGQWAHVWLFFHLPGEPLAFVDLVASSGAWLETSGGDVLAGVVPLDGSGAVSEEAAELYLAIPREWSAAHLTGITVVLLWSTARLWAYPQPVPTWADWGASGATWGGPVPIVLRTEG